MIQNLLICSILILTGCSAAFNIKYNLAEGQILMPTVSRKPTLDRTVGIFTKYRNYLEGYVTGGIVDTEGRTIQGAIVRINGVEEDSLGEFKEGITDGEGMYKVHFSIPIQWNRVNFTGSVSVDPPWQVLAPKPNFTIRYIGKAGVLAYYAVPMWIPVTGDYSREDEFVFEPPPPPVKKPPSDTFGDFDFGP